jgi:hypothetical protein
MRYALLMIALIITSLSCRKDPVDDAAKQTALTTGTWKLTGYTTDYDKDGVYEENTYSMLADCEKDNIHTFQADGSKITDEGPTKCISSNPQTRTSSWAFSDHQTRLQLGGYTYDIEELTTTTLRLKARVAYNVIYTIDVRSTYTKQ